MKLHLLLDAAANHDNNEERHYLAEGRRWSLTWSWIWTSFTLGVGADYERWGDESGSAWVHLGFLTVEVYRRRAPLRGAR